MCAVSYAPGLLDARGETNIFQNFYFKILHHILNQTEIITKNSLRKAFNK